MSELKSCKCGSNIFKKTIPTKGYWTEYLELMEDGSIDRESTTGDLKSAVEPKTIKCEECGKRQPNPDCPTSKPTVAP